MSHEGGTCAGKLRVPRCFHPASQGSGGEIGCGETLGVSESSTESCGELQRVAESCRELQPPL